MENRVYTLVCPAGCQPFGGVNGHPNYRTNQDRTGRDPSECCVVCGKRATGNLYVYLSNVSEYITEAEYVAQEDACNARGACSDDLGMYPVGSDCAKKLRAAGIPLVRG